MQIIYGFAVGLAALILAMLLVAIIEHEFCKPESASDYERRLEREHLEREERHERKVY